MSSKNTFTLFIALAATCNIFGDTIILKNGNVLQGTIVKKDDDKIMIKIRKALIKSPSIQSQQITTQEKYRDIIHKILLKDGSILMGTIDFDDKKNLLIKNNNFLDNQLTIPQSDIINILPLSKLNIQLEEGLNITGEGLTDEHGSIILEKIEKPDIPIEVHQKKIGEISGEDQDMSKWQENRKSGKGLYVAVSGIFFFPLAPYGILQNFNINGLLNAEWALINKMIPAIPGYISQFFALYYLNWGNSSAKASGLSLVGGGLIEWKLKNSWQLSHGYQLGGGTAFLKVSKDQLRANHIGGVVTAEYFIRKSFAQFYAKINLGFHSYFSAEPLWTSNLQLSLGYTF